MSTNHLGYVPLSVGILIFVMYFIVCRVIARELMPTARTGKIFAVYWVVGVITFGTFMQLTAPDNPWVAAAIYVAPFAAVLALAFFYPGR
jgi:hypothetical protein